MSKRVIRLTESELKNYIRKVVSEQGSYNPTGYESDINGDNNTPKQTGEPTVPFEKTGPSVPTSTISSDVLARKIADIEKMKKSANFLQYIKTYGHTSKESWDAAMAGGYAPYVSPQLKAQAQKAGYFPYTDMEDKRADYAKKGIGPMKRPVPPQKQMRRPVPQNGKPIPLDPLSQKRPIQGQRPPQQGQGYPTRTI